jgi:glycosyltransferase involved in cell wall biosynthesis
VALLRLVAHLDRDQYRPVAVLPGAGPLVPKLEAAGCQVRLLAMQQLRSVKHPLYQLGYLGRFWPTVLRLAGLLKEEEAQLVHTNSLFSLYGGWAARLAGVPHVWHIREIPEVPAPIRKLLATMALRLSARVVAMTEAVAELFGPASRRPAPVLCIPDGIDLQTFHPRVSGARIRRDLAIDADAPLVGFVARLDPWKGAEVFLQAAAQVSRRRPEARFLVCGGELPGYQAYAQGVERLADRLGLKGRVSFTGWRYRLDDIPEVMAALDVLVHCSVRPEPFGLVLVEAMAAAKPVVAFRTGGVPEVITPDVTGLLVAPQDSAALAEAIVQLLTDPVRARALGRAGRARAERQFEVGAYARTIEALYASVLAAEGAPRA